MTRRGTLIGRADGLDVYVTAELRPVRESGQTVDHTERPAGAMRLSLTGEAWRPRARREPDACGQITDLVRIISPDLADLWDRWHMNDLRAACAHMPATAFADWNARRDVVCPLTGYRYGTAWLYEALPADIVEQLNALGVPVDYQHVPAVRT